MELNLKLATSRNVVVLVINILAFYFIKSNFETITRCDHTHTHTTDTNCALNNNNNTLSSNVLYGIQHCFSLVLFSSVLPSAAALCKSSTTDDTLTVSQSVDFLSSLSLSLSSYFPFRSFINAARTRTRTKNDGQEEEEGEEIFFIYFSFALSVISFHCIIQRSSLHSPHVTDALLLFLLLQKENTHFPPPPPPPSSLAAVEQMKKTKTKTKKWDTTSIPTARNERTLELF